MKLLTSLFLILLFCAPSFAQTFVGNATLDTQNEIDAFGAFAYTKIQGDLKIENSNATDLSSLSTINEVAGKISIQSNDSLTSLNGLENITSTNGLYILNNNRLTTLEGLNELDTIFNECHISYNDSLVSFNGLEDLDYISFNFFILYNNSLETLEGLDNLTKLSNLYGRLLIANNNSLTTINSLHQLTDCHNIEVILNPELSDFNAFENVTKVNDILIRENLALTTLDSAFYQIDSLDNLFYSEQHNVTTLNNFSNLKTCDELKFEYNTGLTSLNLSNLTSSGDLVITGNDSLMNIASFDSLTYLSELTITGSNLVEEFPYFPILDSLINLQIGGFSSVESFTGLSNIQRIHYLKISSNQSLTDLSDFDGLTKLYSIRLTNNNSLKSLDGLENVNGITGFAFLHNDSLSSYCALRNNMSNLDPNISVYFNVSNNMYNPMLSYIPMEYCVHCPSYPLDLTTSYTMQQTSSNQGFATYQWLDANNNFAIIPDDTLQTLSSTTHGNVAVEVNYYGCIDTSFSVTNCVMFPIDVTITDSGQVFIANQDSATYQWLDVDNGYAVISGDTNQSFSSTIYGNIAVEIIYNGCVDTSESVINCAANIIDLSISDSGQVFMSNQNSATYQWLDCDNNFATITGETNQSFSSTIYGNIAVEISYLGCLDTTDCIINCAAFPIDITVSEDGQVFTADQDSSTYQWLDCDNNFAAITGETNQSFSSTSYGNIAVEINRNGCIDTSLCLTNCAALPIDLTVTENGQVFTADQDSATYQWLDCDNNFAAITGETNQSFSSTSYGNIAVEINRNGCIDTSLCLTNCAALPIDINVTENGQIFTADQDSAIYQWLDCNNNYAVITGEINQSFSSTSYGNIAVEINRNGCIDTSLCLTNCAALPIDINVAENGQVFTADQDSATYQWLDCDNNYSPISGETNQSFSSTIYGNIAVEINRNGCMDTSICLTNCAALTIDINVTENGQVFTADQDSATYQWLDCENNFAAITGETNQSFSSTSYGNIAVEINRNGCIDTSLCLTNCTALPIDLTVTESGSTLTANQDSATYQWLDCDNEYAIIPNQTAQLFSLTQDDNVAIEITYLGCTDTTDCFELNSDSTFAIHSFEVISINPFPTPNQMTINFGHLKHLNLIVYNQLGQVVYKKKNINQQVYAFSTNAFSTGLYVIEVYDNKTRKQFKVIIP